MRSPSTGSAGACGSRVARTNQLVHYAAGSRPVLRETFPSIRDAREVSVVGDQVIVSSESENQRLRVRSR